MTHENTLYRAINVFRRRQSGEVIAYRCFEVLPDAGYVVQSADRVRLPVSEKQLRDHTVQFWELLLEEAPERRGPLAPTLEAAIESFEAQFE